MHTCMNACKHNMGAWSKNCKTIPLLKEQGRLRTSPQKNGIDFVSYIYIYIYIYIYMYTYMKYFECLYTLVNPRV